MRGVGGNGSCVKEGFTGVGGNGPRELRKRGVGGHGSCVERWCVWGCMCCCESVCEGSWVYGLDCCGGMGCGGGRVCVVVI